MSESATQVAGVKLQGLILHKLGMASVYGEAGEVIPVTMLRFEPLVVSQVKTKEKDGYEAVQVAGRPLKAGRSNSAEIGHFKGAGFQNGAGFAVEIRQSVPAGAAVGSSVSLDTLSQGDVVSVTSRSKGKGFMGSVRRFNFAGGPAAHGSKFHRQPGSSGNRTWPGRVMPGKKFPGHLGDEVVTLKNVKVVRVLAEEGLVLVKGPVPGARNTIVTVMKQG
jgi:large subunit ribosomal protein L3